MPPPISPEFQKRLEIVVRDSNGFDVANENVKLQGFVTIMDFPILVMTNWRLFKELKIDSISTNSSVAKITLSFV
jgi:hypothetical protein